MGDPSDTERRVVEVWRASGPVLDARRRAELSALSESEALRAAEDLLDLLHHLPPRLGGSGLVEQQALFARAAR